MKATLSEKGQVTIPKTLRERLGLRPGEVLEFREERGRLVATKAEAEDRVGRVIGVLDLDGGTDGFLRELRGDPDAV